MEHLVVGCAFVAGFLLVFGVNLFVVDAMEAKRQQVRRRLDADLRLPQRDRARGSLVDPKIYEIAAAEMLDAPSQPTVRQRLLTLIDESGLPIRPRQLAGACGATALLLWAPTALLGGHWAWGAMVAPLGALIPVIYVSFVRRQRMERMLSQLPDAFDLMSRTMRAGQTVSQALQAVADEFSPPIAEEFGYCFDQQSLGLSPEAAMRDLARRTGLLEVKIFVLAVMVHRQTGGNLSDLLDKLGTVIRDRYRIRGIIKALTAEGRLQATILLALAPATLGLLLLVNPHYEATLFRYPSLLIGMFASMAVGALWMRRIIRFDF